MLVLISPPLQECKTGFGNLSTLTGNWMNWVLPTSKLECPCNMQYNVNSLTNKRKFGEINEKQLNVATILKTKIRNKIPHTFKSCIAGSESGYSTMISKSWSILKKIKIFKNRDNLQYSKNKIIFLVWPSSSNKLFEHYSLNHHRYCRVAVRYHCKTEVLLWPCRIRVKEEESEMRTTVLTTVQEVS